MMFEGKEKRLDLITELRTTDENYQERVMDGVTEAL